MNQKHTHFPVHIKSVSGNNDILIKLLQEYEDEFSLITKKEKNQDGLFDLDVDLMQCDNFLFFYDGVPIGFCVKGILGSRHDIHEYYVCPSHRNRKIGQWCVTEIFKMYKGEWQVRQIMGADAATKFWRKAIAEFTGSALQEFVDNDEHWGWVTKQVFLSP